jgi:hypothetical protein
MRSLHEPHCRQRCALTDARSPELQLGTSVVISDGVIEWISPTDAEPGRDRGRVGARLTVDGRDDRID